MVLSSGTQKVHNELIANSDYTEQETDGFSTLWIDQPIDLVSYTSVTFNLTLVDDIFLDILLVDKPSQSFLIQQSTEYLQIQVTTDYYNIGYQQVTCQMTQRILDTTEPDSSLISLQRQIIEMESEDIILIPYSSSSNYFQLQLLPQIDSQSLIISAKINEFQCGFASIDLTTLGLPQFDYLPYTYLGFLSSKETLQGISNITVLKPTPVYFGVKIMESYYDSVENNGQNLKIIATAIIQDECQNELDVTQYGFDGFSLNITRTDGFSDFNCSQYFYSNNYKIVVDASCDDVGQQLESFTFDVSYNNVLLINSGENQTFYFTQELYDMYGYSNLTYIVVEDTDLTTKQNNAENWYTYMNQRIRILCYDQYNQPFKTTFASLGLTINSDYQSLIFDPNLGIYDQSQIIQVPHMNESSSSFTIIFRPKSPTDYLLYSYYLLAQPILFSVLNSTSIYLSRTLSYTQIISSESNKKSIDVQNRIQIKVYLKTMQNESYYQFGQCDFSESYYYIETTKYTFQDFSQLPSIYTTTLIKSGLFSYSLIINCNTGDHFEIQCLENCETQVTPLQKYANLKFYQRITHSYDKEITLDPPDDIFYLSDSTNFAFSIQLFDYYWNPMNIQLETNQFSLSLNDTSGNGFSTFETIIATNDGKVHFQLSDANNRDARYNKYKPKVGFYIVELSYSYYQGDTDKRTVKFNLQVLSDDVQRPINVYDTTVNYTTYDKYTTYLSVPTIYRAGSVSKIFLTLKASNLQQINDISSSTWSVTFFNKDQVQYDTSNCQYNAQNYLYEGSYIIYFFCATTIDNEGLDLTLSIGGDVVINTLSLQVLQNKPAQVYQYQSTNQSIVYPSSNSASILVNYTTFFLNISDQVACVVTNHYLAGYASTLGEITYTIQNNNTGYPPLENQYFYQCENVNGSVCMNSSTITYPGEYTLGIPFYFQNFSSLLTNVSFTSYQFTVDVYKSYGHAEYYSQNFIQVSFSPRSAYQTLIFKAGTYFIKIYGIDDIGNQIFLPIQSESISNYLIYKSNENEINYQVNYRIQAINFQRAEVTQILSSFQFAKAPSSLISYADLYLYDPDTKNTLLLNSSDSSYQQYVQLEYGYDIVPLIFQLSLSNNGVKFKNALSLLKEQQSIKLELSQMQSSKVEATFLGSIIDIRENDQKHAYFFYPDTSSPVPLETTLYKLTLTIGSSTKQFGLNVVNYDNAADQVSQSFYVYVPSHIEIEAGTPYIFKSIVRGSTTSQLSIEGNNNFTGTGIINIIQTNLTQYFVTLVQPVAGTYTLSLNANDTTSTNTYSQTITIVVTCNSLDKLTIQNQVSSNRFIYTDNNDYFQDVSKNVDIIFALEDKYGNPITNHYLNKEQINVKDLISVSIDEATNSHYDQPLDKLETTFLFENNYLTVSVMSKDQGIVNISSSFFSQDYLINFTSLQEVSPENSIAYLQSSKQSYVASSRSKIYLEIILRDQYYNTLSYMPDIDWNSFSDNIVPLNPGCPNQKILINQTSLYSKEVVNGKAIVTLSFVMTQACAYNLRLFYQQMTQVPCDNCKFHVVAATPNLTTSQVLDDREKVLTLGGTGNYYLKIHKDRLLMFVNFYDTYGNHIRRFIGSNITVSLTYKSSSDYISYIDLCLNKSYGLTTVIFCPGNESLSNELLAKAQSAPGNPLYLSFRKYAQLNTSTNMKVTLIDNFDYSWDQDSQGMISAANSRIKIIQGSNYMLLQRPASFDQNMCLQGNYPFVGIIDVRTDRGFSKWLSDPGIILQAIKVEATGKTMIEMYTGEFNGQIVFIVYPLESFYEYSSQVTIYLNQTEFKKDTIQFSCDKPIPSSNYIVNSTYQEVQNTTVMVKSAGEIISLKVQALDINEEQVYPFDPSIILIALDGSEMPIRQYKPIVQDKTNLAVDISFKIFKGGSFMIKDLSEYGCYYNYLVCKNITIFVNSSYSDINTTWTNIQAKHYTTDQINAGDMLTIEILIFDSYGNKLLANQTDLNNTLAILVAKQNTFEQSYNTATCSIDSSSVINCQAQAETAGLNQWMVRYNGMIVEDCIGCVINVYPGSYSIDKTSIVPYKFNQAFGSDQYNMWLKEEQGSGSAFLRLIFRDNYGNQVISAPSTTNDTIQLLLVNNKINFRIEQLSLPNTSELISSIAYLSALSNQNQAILEFQSLNNGWYNLMLTLAGTTMITEHIYIMDKQSNPSNYQYSDYYSPELDNSIKTTYQYTSQQKQIFRIQNVPSTSVKVNDVSDQTQPTLMYSRLGFNLFALPFQFQTTFNVDCSSSSVVLSTNLTTLADEAAYGYNYSLFHNENETLVQIQRVGENDPSSISVVCDNQFLKRDTYTSFFFTNTTETNTYYYNALYSLYYNPDTCSIYVQIQNNSLANYTIFNQYINSTSQNYYFSIYSLPHNQAVIENSKVKLFYITNSSFEMQLKLNDKNGNMVYEGSEITPQNDILINIYQFTNGIYRNISTWSYDTSTRIFECTQQGTYSFEVIYQDRYVVPCAQCFFFCLKVFIKTTTQNTYNSISQSKSQFFLHQQDSITDLTLRNNNSYINLGKTQPFFIEWIPRDVNQNFIGLVLGSTFNWTILTPDGQLYTYLNHQSIFNGRLHIFSAQVNKYSSDVYDSMRELNANQNYSFSLSDGMDNYITIRVRLSENLFYLQKVQYFKLKSQNQQNALPVMRYADDSNTLFLWYGASQQVLVNLVYESGQVYQEGYIYSFEAVGSPSGFGPVTFLRYTNDGQYLMVVNSVTTLPINNFTNFSVSLVQQFTSKYIDLINPMLILPSYSIVPSNNVTIILQDGRYNTKQGGTIIFNQNFGDMIIFEMQIINNISQVLQSEDFDHVKQATEIYENGIRKKFNLQVFQNYTTPENTYFSFTIHIENLGINIYEMYFRFNNTLYNMTETNPILNITASPYNTTLATYALVTNATITVQELNSSSYLIINSQKLTSIVFYALMQANEVCLQAYVDMQNIQDYIFAKIVENDTEILTIQLNIWQNSLNKNCPYSFRGEISLFYLSHPYSTYEIQIRYQDTLLNKQVFRIAEEPSNLDSLIRFDKFTQAFNYFNGMLNLYQNKYYTVSLGINPQSILTKVFTTEQIQFSPNSSMSLITSYYNKLDGNLYMNVTFTQSGQIIPELTFQTQTFDIDLIYLNIQQQQCDIFGSYLTQAPLNQQYNELSNIQEFTYSFICPPPEESSSESSFVSILYQSEIDYLIYQPVYANYSKTQIIIPLYIQESGIYNMYIFTNGETHFLPVTFNMTDEECSTEFPVKCSDSGICVKSYLDCLDINTTMCQNSSNPYYCEQNQACVSSLNASCCDPLTSFWCSSTQSCVLLQEQNKCCDQTYNSTPIWCNTFQICVKSNTECCEDLKIKGIQMHSCQNITNNLSNEPKCAISEFDCFTQVTQDCLAQVVDYRYSTNDTLLSLYKGCWDNSCQIECPSERVCSPGYILCPSTNTCVKQNQLNLCTTTTSQRCYNETTGITQYYCAFDGQCVNSQNECPSLITCSNITDVVCPDGSCQPSPYLCSSPNYDYCSSQGLVLCTDNTCASSYSQCSKYIHCSKGFSLCEDKTCRHNCTNITNICPLNQIQCHSGECKNFQSQCSSSKICPESSPILCWNDACSNSYADCSYYDSESYCFNKTICSDGSCRSSQEECPTPVSCNGMIKCHDDRCAYSLDECFPVDECESFLCSTGECVATIYDCPTTVTCPKSLLYKCENHQCVDSPQYCIGISQQLHELKQSKSDCPVLCLDGTCAQSHTLCPSSVICPENAPILCWDRTCTPDLDSCAEPISVSNVCGIINNNFTYQCPTGNCFEYPNQCPTLLICPLLHELRPVKCFDGSCRASYSQCPVFQPCPYSGMSQCPDGTCTYTGNCNSLVTCASNVPYQCGDGTCQSDTSLCSPDFQTDGCNKNQYFCGFDNQCYNNRSYCFEQRAELLICPVDYPVKGPDFSCYQRIEDYSQLSFSECPYGYVQCKDDQCKLDYSECSEYTCNDPVPYKCSNGLCAQDLSLCNSADTGCPFYIPYRCTNGTCVSSDTECVTAICPNNSTLLCQDGSCSNTTCRLNKMGCPFSVPYKCATGSCVASSSLCTIQENTYCSQYTSTHIITCNDGLCVEKQSQCSIDHQSIEDTLYCMSVVGSQSQALYLCGDGTCVFSYMQCVPLMECSEPMIRCNDGSCRDSISSCPITDKSCPPHKPYRCLNNMCVANLDTDCLLNLNGCPQYIPYYCQDIGRCVINKDYCTYETVLLASTNSCPSNYTYCDQTDTCIPSSETCQLSCSPDTPYQCGTTCLANAQDCTSNVCPDDSFLCPDMSCASSLSDCMTKSYCNLYSPFKCGDLTCKTLPLGYNSTDICLPSQQCSSKTPIKCSDGSCQSSSYYCPLITNCTYRCPQDNRCVSNLTECNYCPYGAPFRCVNSGTCTSNPNTCQETTSQQCPPEAPIRCFDGRCAPGYQFCIRTSENYQTALMKSSQSRRRRLQATPDLCPNQYMCSDGSCREDYTMCPRIDACYNLSAPIRCAATGLCVSSQEACSDTKYTMMSCTESQRMCPDGICRENTTSCPIYKGCNADKPYQCPNGFCAEDINSCAGSSQCASISLPFRCSNFTCVASSSDCEFNYANYLPVSMQIHVRVMEDYEVPLVFHPTSHTVITYLTIYPNSIYIDQSQVSLIQTMIVNGLSDEILRSSVVPISENYKRLVNIQIPLSSSQYLSYEYGVISPVFNFTLVNYSKTFNYPMQLKTRLNYPSSTLDIYNDVCLANLIDPNGESQWVCISRNVTDLQNGFFQFQIQNPGILAVIISPNPDQLSNSTVLVSDSEVIQQRLIPECNWVCEHKVLFLFLQIVGVSLFFICGIICWIHSVSSKSNLKVEKEVIDFSQKQNSNMQQQYEQRLDFENEERKKKEREMIERQAQSDVKPSMYSNAGYNSGYNSNVPGSDEKARRYDRNMFAINGSISDFESKDFLSTNKKGERDSYDVENKEHLFQENVEAENIPKFMAKPEKKSPKKKSSKSRSPHHSKKHKTSPDIIYKASSKHHNTKGVTQSFNDNQIQQQKLDFDRDSTQFQKMAQSVVNSQNNNMFNIQPSNLTAKSYQQQVLLTEEARDNSPLVKVEQKSRPSQFPTNLPNKRYNSIEEEGSGSKFNFQSDNGSEKKNILTSGDKSTKAKERYVRDSKEILTSIQEENLVKSTSSRISKNKLAKEEEKKGEINNDLKKSPNKRKKNKNEMRSQIDDLLKDVSQNNKKNAKNFFTSLESDSFSQKKNE